MPAMNMAENAQQNGPEARPRRQVGRGGDYVGAGQIMMGGTWNATVTVKVGGKDYAEKKTTLTAK
jgi:hypothetical protein